MISGVTASSMSTLSASSTITRNRPGTMRRPAHFFGVAADQIIVDGDYVNRLAAPAPDAGGQRGGDGFALAGGHFGDEPFAHGQCAHDLHGIGTFSNRAEAAFANDGHAAIEGAVFEAIEPGQDAAFFNGLAHLCS